MAVFKCKMCGGTLEIKNNESVATCEYCGTQQTLPKLDDERRAILYDRANHFRRNNEFDKALGIYEQILSEDNTDAEAHWSIILCKYGIEYVEDPKTNKRVPTVNRAQFTSIFDDDNYTLALKYADAFQEEIYKAEAEAINEIQKGILEISQKEEPFDVFICYKEQDNKGERTQDSVIAQELYYQLEKEGIRTFFARVTLEDKLGVAYEPYIFAALNSAKAMVVLGTKPEHLNAVWVKNEWSRYLALIKKGENKTLIPVYQDMDPYDLPEAFSHLQAQDMSKVGAMQDLVHGLKKIVDVDSKAAAQTAGTTAIIVDTMLKRAENALDAKDWQQATRCYENVLDYDERNKQAYIGKMLVDFKVSSLEELANGTLSISKHASYKFLTEGLEDETSNNLKQVEETIQNRISEIKAAKKAKATKIRKRLTLIFSSIVLCVAIGIGTYFLITDFIIPQSKYNSAVKMVNNKQFDEAINQFELLGEYKDSKDKINETYILKGDYLVENGDYDNALKSYAQAHQSNESQEKMSQVAEKYIQIGEYYKAREVYTHIPGSEGKINEVNYLNAKSEKEKGNYTTAISILRANGLTTSEYKDSAKLHDDWSREAAKIEFEKKNYREALIFIYNISVNSRTEADKDFINECTYLFAHDYDKNGNWLVAREKFLSIESYKDSAQLAKQCLYKYTNSLMAGGHYSSAIDNYKTLGNYLDSAEKLKEAKYGYINANKNNDNTTTFEYLKELKAIGYKDTANIYKELYK